MAARYLRPLSGRNLAWFYIHVTCQCTGYVMGVASWAMGLRLYTYHDGGAATKHRNIGISIFALATLQVSINPQLFFPTLQWSLKHQHLFSTNLHRSFSFKGHEFSCLFQMSSCICRPTVANLLENLNFPAYSYSTLFLTSTLF